jgi:hypothetical protein
MRTKLPARATEQGEWAGPINSEATNLGGGMSHQPTLIMRAPGFLHRTTLEMCTLLDRKGLVANIADDIRV